ncbi:MAG TPA: lysophospholipid acyltransferase family protein [Candidatus Thermoplasmatota archaeon]|nr:lysophospholipid acyltransferase family protein [Candidatus Thermoplasmatota archaeon]
MGRLPTWNPTEWKRAGWFYRGVYRTIRRPLVASIRLHGRGVENFPRTGPAIVASNHYTYADPVLLAAITPRPYTFLAKSGLFKYRLSNWFFRSSNCLPVYRGKGEGNEATLLASRGILERGGLVAIYPEATRAPPGEMLPGKTGAVRLALETGAPIVPVACATDEFWPLKKTFPRLGRGAWYNIGKPIHLGKDLELAKDRDYCRKATDDLMTQIRALLTEAQAARDRREKWNWSEQRR